ncbi:MAG TPA: gpW family head-tail joining protein, partial [Burkholderiales bacterium]|nr:gpW family head-tail joining protein [Burkholderiales bacterium]
ATLQQWLTEAYAARHAFSTGTLTSTVEHGDMRLGYRNVNAGNIEAYIQALEAQIANLQAGYQPLRRRAITVNGPC